MDKDTPEVTGQGAEDQGEKDAAAAAAAEEATAKEASEKTEKPETEEEGKEKTAKELTPEEQEKRRHNAREATRRLEQKRLRDLEIENARLRGFQEGVNKAGGKTGHDDTAGEPDAKALRSEFEREHPKPKEADYQTFEDFTEALTDWNYDRRKFIDSKTTEVKTHRETQGQEMARMQEAFSKQVEAGEAEFGEEFEDVIRGLKIPDPMQVAILTSPEGHKVAYYLHQNPKEADRIADLSPFLQAKEIGKIESKIEAGTIQLKKTTKAPPPPKTLGGKGDSGPMKMTDDDYLKRHREKKIAKLSAGAT